MTVAVLDFVITYLIASNKPSTDDDDLSVIFLFYFGWWMSFLHLHFASIWSYSRCSERWLWFFAAWQSNMKYMSGVKYEVKKKI